MNRNLVMAIGVLFLFMVLLYVYKVKTIESQGGKTPIVKVEPTTYEKALDSVTSRELMEEVYYLASDRLEGRLYGSKGAQTAALYIGGQLEEMGLFVEYHRFEVYDTICQNVYGWIEGKTDDVIVVGAHYDHLGEGFPGADDNASGTACVLEIAEAFSKLFAKTKPERTIVFQFYSAEEYGLHGSRFYCRHPTLPIDDPNIRKHIFMLNLDMVGYLNQGVYKTFKGYNSSPDLNRIIDDLSRKYLFANNITSRGRGASDHIPFMNHSIPVVFLHTGMHNNYHTSMDTAEKLNYKGMENISKYAFELTYRVSQGQRPRFNNVGFKEVECTHDHDQEIFRNK